MLCPSRGWGAEEPARLILIRAFLQTTDGQHLILFSHDAKWAIISPPACSYKGTNSSHQGSTLMAQEHPRGITQWRLSFNMTAEVMLTFGHVIFSFWNTSIGVHPSELCSLMVYCGLASYSAHTTEAISYIRRFGFLIHAYQWLVNLSSQSICTQGVLNRYTVTVP